MADDNIRLLIATEGLFYALKRCNEDEKYTWTAYLLDKIVQPRLSKHMNIFQKSGLYVTFSPKKAAQEVIPYLSSAGFYDWCCESNLFQYFTDPDRELSEDEVSLLHNNS